MFRVFVNASSEVLTPNLTVLRAVFSGVVKLEKPADACERFAQRIAAIQLRDAQRTGLCKVFKIDDSQKLCKRLQKLQKYLTVHIHSLKRRHISISALHPPRSRVVYF